MRLRHIVGLDGYVLDGRMIKITSQLANRLKGHALIETHKAYLHAESFISKNHVNSRQHEVVYVANLCRSMSSLANAWRREFRRAGIGKTLSMSTVFTHQSPRVQWSSNGCELADLLVAVVDNTIPMPKGIAVLIQAKLSQDGIARINNSSERKQYELLATRPIFNVGKNGPQAVNLQNYKPDSALIYGLATKSPLWNSGGTWLGADNLNHQYANHAGYVNPTDCFPSFLVGMLQGNYGWEFSPLLAGSQSRKLISGQSDNWSGLINYLLKVTFSMPLTQRQRSYAGVSGRGKTDSLFLSSNFSSGGKMFFISNGIDSSKMHNYFSPDDDGNSWIESSEEIFFDGGGRSGWLGNFGEEPSEGPISAIVFEIGNNEMVE